MISSWADLGCMRWRALRFMTRNSNFQFDSVARLHRKAPRFEAKIDTRARIGARTAAVVPVWDRVREPRFVRIRRLGCFGRNGMRYFVALFILSSGIASSNATTLLDKLRLAQTQTSAECIANCNSSNFSCAQNCGLSGSCVAQCAADASSCKSRCGEPK
jgi:hypothetical protein